jgi:hypothetical protein
MKYIKKKNILNYIIKYTSNISFFLLNQISRIYMCTINLSMEAKFSQTSYNYRIIFLLANNILK